jgi:hypothetical protein
VDKTTAAVKDRLTKEINYWDHRAEDLRAQEAGGRVNAKLNSALARKRADELQARLESRLAELAQERRLSALPPVVIGGALVIPVGLLRKLQGEEPKEYEDAFALERAEIESRAMKAVMECESRLGYEPCDVSAERRGYDIESRVPGTGKLRFIEVKGRRPDAATVTISRNEILTALNKPEDFILALVEVGVDTALVRYLYRPFQREPDFGVTSVNYDLRDLLDRAEAPR